MFRKYDISKETLQDLYEKQQLSARAIACIYRTSHSTILNLLRLNNIHPRNSSERLLVAYQKKRRQAYRVSLPIPDNTLINMYIKQQMSIADIARKLEVKQHQVRATLLRLRIKHRSRKEASRLYHKTHPQFTKHKNGSGYIMAKAPNHLRADQHGFVPEHILVWEQTHSQPVPNGYHIHHINGVRDDNRPDNIIALPPPIHSKLSLDLIQHNQQRRIRELEEKVENYALKAGAFDILYSCFGERMQDEELELMDAIVESIVLDGQERTKWLSEQGDNIVIQS